MKICFPSLQFITETQILLLQRLRGGRAAGGGVQCNMFGEWDPDAEGQLLQRQARK